MKVALITHSPSLLRTKVTVGTRRISRRSPILALSINSGPCTSTLNAQVRCQKEQPSISSSRASNLSGRCLSTKRAPLSDCSSQRATPTKSGRISYWPSSVNNSPLPTKSPESFYRLVAPTKFLFGIATALTTESPHRSKPT